MSAGPPSAGAAAAQRYIVASCKPWHRPGFERLAAESKGDFALVESKEALLAEAERLDPRYIFFLHWNWHVPRAVWERYECVCFHMTDVPYGRGGSPLQNLILAGHGSTKLTALRMVEEMDAGPVYAKRPVSLAGRAQEIYERVGDASFELIRWMVETEPEPAPQVGETVAFKRRTPDQSALPGDCDLARLYDFIRMLDAETYPRAFIEHGAFRLEFSNARLSEGRLTAEVVITPRGGQDGDRR